MVGIGVTEIKKEQGMKLRFWIVFGLCVMAFSDMSHAETCVGETFNVTYDCGDGVAVRALLSATTATYGGVFTPELLDATYCTPPSGMAISGIEVWPGNEYNGAFSTSGDKFEFYYTSDIVIKPRYVGPASADIIWRLRRVNGSSYVYDRNAQTWRVNFPYGYVSGVAKCTDIGQTSVAVGWAAGIIASDQAAIENASAGGQYCYCKMTEPLVAASPWVFNVDQDDASSCASLCAYFCGGYVQDYAVFRASVFSAAGD